MGRNNWFEFKQFRIEQQKAAMKVGTDGVLLGAWIAVGDACRMLDVGTGTGLIALMLAQRSLAIIDAIEIDDFAFEEARFNFVHSPWSDRLNAVSGDFVSFSNHPEETYDLIVSNPPFFINSLKTSDAATTIARHDEKLSFDQLIFGVRRLLNYHGRLGVIIPFESGVGFRESARLHGFYLKQWTSVIPKIGKLSKRVLLEFGLQPCYPVENKLVILDESGTYTENYKSLTAPFYPAF